MKECKSCGQFKPKLDFNKKASNQDGLNAHCRPCQRKRQREYYINVDRVKQVRRASRDNLRRNLTIRSFILQYLESHPCIDCGEVDPIVLEFDHVRGEKRFSISGFQQCTHSLKVVQAEILKCEVRCSNCHKKRHAMRVQVSLGLPPGSRNMDKDPLEKAILLLEIVVNANRQHYNNEFHLTIDNNAMYKFDKGCKELGIKKLKKGPDVTLKTTKEEKAQKRRGRKKRNNS